MIRKTKFHRILALICAIVCVSTSFVCPVSASQTLIPWEYTIDASETSFYSPNDDDGHVSPVVFDSTPCTASETTEGWLISFNDDAIACMIDEWDMFSDLSHSWQFMYLYIVPELDITYLDLKNIDLLIEWRYDTDADNSIPSDTLSQHLSTLINPTLCDKTSIGLNTHAVPSVGSYKGASLPLKGDNFKIDGDCFYDSYLFTSTSEITSILDGGFEFGLPYNFYGCSQNISLSLNMTLIRTDPDEPVIPEDTTPPEDTTAPDVTDEPDEPNTDVPVIPPDNFGFQKPEVYSYDTRFYFTPGKDGQITDGYEVTDFYLQNNSIRFKDTTDSIFTVSMPWDGYSLHYSFTYADGYSASDFTDTIFRTYTVDLETQLSTDLIYTGADLSKYGFRLHFYIECGDSPNFDFAEFKNYVEKASTSFYGFEPFSIKAGSVVIPFEYWKLEFNATNSCIRATLELDGKNSAHESFMRALASNQQYVSINFTLGNDTTFLFGTGKNSNGFWIKYSDSSVTPGNPDTPTTGGFSQEDLDAAYNKGYNKGAADNGGTNYVFAFVNGLWSGFGQFYSLVTNGISIGGISLNMIITSIIIIAVFVIVIKKVT